tara:strand:+ start:136 stop:333 length:198 start_codon:yes stop_codon:yes gene_type:complete
MASPKTIEYKIKRSVVEKVHKDEFFLVEADSLEEAKRMVDEHEIAPYSQKEHHYELVEASDAEEG